MAALIDADADDADDPQPSAPAGRPGLLALTYAPDGPLGGTFTCVACSAQAWQPDLLDHAPACPHHPRRPMTPR